MPPRKDDAIIRQRMDDSTKRRALQRAEAPIAMREYRAAQQAAIDRMKKLREQRLARDTAQKETRRQGK